MTVGIIGGGFTGLTAAYELSKHGHSVTVFEREPTLGGLTLGYKRPNWKWSLEKAYHHWFTSDDAILSLARELGLPQILVRRPVTATYYKGAAYQFDSPFHLLAFPGLSLADKLRTGALAAFCKLYPFWQHLEGVTARSFFRTIGGAKAWSVIWEPLMTGKFGHLDSSIAASWLWARINKRTPSLAYPSGGFQTVVDKLADEITGRGGTMLTNVTVAAVERQKNGFAVKLSTGESHPCAKVLITTPTPIAKKIAPVMPDAYFDLPLTIPHLHAQTLILETTAPILANTYWLNVTDRTFPFLAVVTHTNFMDKAHYGGHHITYFGNYLPPNHPYLTMSAKELLKLFTPYIKKLCPSFREQSTVHFELFTGLFAQPVHQIHYSRKAPKLVTPFRNLFLANLDSIYPWDRGTNYAVVLGKLAAKTMMSSV